MSKQSTNSLTIAINYFHAWRSSSFNRAASFLADHISFEMPINKYENKEAFMQAVQFTAMASSDINLISCFENHNEALLLYNLTISSIGTITIAEHFIIENEKIVFIRHVHDTYEFRKGGFDKSNS